MCASSGSSSPGLNTIRVSITPAGVIKLETGKMATMHANVGDAIAAVWKLAGVSQADKQALAHALAHAHGHEHEHEHNR